MRVLVIGVNIRHIAASACRAGHEVIAVDAFCDRDLPLWAQQNAVLSRTDWQRELPEFVKRFQPEALLLGPGLERADLSKVPSRIRILNNSAEKCARVSDKLWLARWLERRGYPFIRTASSPEGLSYPFLVKPRSGAGGVGCRIVHSPEDLFWERGLIAQEMIEGVPASVSVIGSEGEARAIADNEQLIGASWAGAVGFRYSGNITPLVAAPVASSRCDMKEMVSEMREISERIVSDLELVGSNGVDFLITRDGPVAVEVNCRFQGSLDTVEAAYGINLFEAHCGSFEGTLPQVPARADRIAARALLYASRELTVDADLLFSWTSDVPHPGSRISADEPIISILSCGGDRMQALDVLKERAATIFGLVRGW